MQYAMGLTRLIRLPRMRGDRPALQKWLKAATSEERKDLVLLYGRQRTTIATLAGAYATQGVLHLTPDTAARLEEVFSTLHREGLPQVTRADLSPVCASCPHRHG